MPAVKMLFSFAIYVARDKKLVSLIDVPVKADVMDPIVPSPNQPRPPWHPFVLAKDGLSISVTSECHRRQAAARTEEERVWNALSADLDKRICNARGRYVWRNGRFTSAS